MKKNLLVVASFVLAVFTASAQEGPRPEGPEQHHQHHPMMAEGNVKPEPKKLTLEVGFCPFQSTSTTLENSRLNGSYSFNEKWAIRLGLGWGVKSEEDAAENETTTSSFSFVPGFTYSFKGTHKMTPYVGAELIFAAGSTKYEPKNGSEVESSNSSFGVQGFTGMNYYFSKNLYVGVEFGIGMRANKEEDEKDNESSTFEFAPYAQPAVRLGWTF